MKSELNEAVCRAAIKILIPLVRILLRHGISHGSFCELSKWAYVNAASESFTIEGRKQTDSRIAVLTGLSRKEVRRMRGITTHEDLSAHDRYNRSVRVISGWRRDSRFLDSRGQPAKLPFDNGKVSFASLVKRYSGDIPARAVLDEMLRTGIVKRHDGNIKLLTKGYIVRKEESEKIQILGSDVSELIATISHNMENDSQDAFFQRKVSYDSIPENVLIQLRKRVHAMSEKFIKSVDKLISGYDRDINSSLKGTDSRKSGLGIFYFE